jgi:hypothetical protein
MHGTAKILLPLVDGGSGVRALPSFLSTLAGAASLFGCDYIGTAGTPTTVEGAPMTTEPTPATAGASAEERANLLQSMNDSFSALAAGIWLLGPRTSSNSLTNRN